MTAKSGAVEVVYRTYWSLVKLSPAVVSRLGMGSIK